MKTNYSQVVEMTDEEKYKMYMKLSKKEIVKMHIELENMVRLFNPITNVNTWPIGYPTYDNTAKPFSPPFFVTCPDNGI